MFDLSAARDRLALALLAPLLALSIYGALIVPWHSASSIDSRTHIEMIRAISDRGLPYAFNGPVEKYPELQVAWNVARGERIWGSYPPVYAYVAAPFFRVGGLVAVSRLSMALLAFLALGAYALGKRYTGDPVFGSATAWVTLGATSAPASAFDIGPYILAITLVTWATAFTLTSLDEEGARSRSYAAASGLIGAIAIGTHLLTFPIVGALLVALALFRGKGCGWGWGPTKESLLRGAIAAGCTVLVLLPIAALNHARFGAWNPISYGPCVWARCEGTGLAHQSPRAMVAFAAPVLGWLAVTSAFLWLGRRSPPKLALIATCALLVLYFVPALRSHGAALFTIGFGYVADVSRVDMPPMVRAADGLGVFNGPFVIKSTLQCTPAFALIALAPRGTPREKQLSAAIALPCAGLFLLLALRANIPAVHALGYPLLYLRYVMPALPLLAALSVAAVRGLAWQRWHLALLVGLSTALSLWFYFGSDDLGFFRRLVLLRGTLALGVAAVALGALARRDGARARKFVGPAAVVATVAFAFGFGITTGLDLPVTMDIRDDNDHRVDAVAALTPARFALVGYSAEIDVPLTLRATRDIECGDLWESGNWNNLRQLIDYWTSQARPIYALWPHAFPMRSPWPDVSFEVVSEKEGLFLLKKSGTAQR